MQQIQRQQNRLAKYTKSFGLQVSLQRQEMFISLFDFKNKILYSKSYSEDDIGKQIHRKIDLADLYTSISQSSESDQAITQMLNKFAEYQFGTVISFKGIPCFKIEDGGKLTIFVTLTERKTCKQINCESTLNLNKIKDLTQVQVSQLNKYRTKCKKQRLIQTYFQQLKKQNTKIKVQLKELMLKFNSQIQNYQKQLNIKIDLLNNNFIKCQQQRQHKENQLKILKQEKLHLFNQRKQLKFLFNLKQPFFQQFRISKSLTIQYIGKDSTNTQIMFNRQIPIYEQYIFKIKIVRLQGNYLWIGIVDYFQQNNQRSSYNCKYALCYASNGYTYQIGKCANTGKRFSEGQIVQVAVSLSLKKFKCSIGGIQKACLSSDILNDPNRIFVPFVQFSRPNDMIQFSE